VAAVVALNLDHPPGATPLDPDEAEGLRVPAATRRDLNALEQANILDALRWLEGRRRRSPEKDCRATAGANPNKSSLERHAFGLGELCCTR
jgi:hypothetical protein